jgi:hypothetical protein
MLEVVRGVRGNVCHELTEGAFVRARNEETANATLMDWNATLRLLHFIRMVCDGELVSATHCKRIVKASQHQDITVDDQHFRILAQLPHVQLVC